MSEHRELVNAYIQMVEERCELGFEGSLLTFMFKDMKGSEASRKERMIKEVDRIFRLLLTRFIKRPEKTPLMQMPFFLGCVDWPVHKNVKKAIGGIANNDGMHFGGIYMLPPVTRTAMNLEDVVARNNREIMRSGMLTHIHVKPMLKTPRKAAGYALKSVDRFRVGSAEILILPRHHSEIQR